MVEGRQAGQADARRLGVDLENGHAIRGISDHQQDIRNMGVGDERGLAGQAPVGADSRCINRHMAFDPARRGAGDSDCGDLNAAGQIGQQTRLGCIVIKGLKQGGSKDGRGQQRRAEQGGPDLFHNQFQRDGIAAKAAMILVDDQPRHAQIG